MANFGLPLPVAVQGKGIHDFHCSSTFFHLVKSHRAKRTLLTHKEVCIEGNGSEARYIGVSSLSIAAELGWPPAPEHQHKKSIGNGSAAA